MSAKADALEVHAFLQSKPPPPGGVCWSPEGTCWRWEMWPFVPKCPQQLYQTFQLSAFLRNKTNSSFRKLLTVIFFPFSNASPASENHQHLSFRCLAYYSNESRKVQAVIICNLGANVSLFSTMKENVQCGKGGSLCYRLILKGFCEDDWIDVFKILWYLQMDIQRVIFTIMVVFC